MKKKIPYGEVAYGDLGLVTIEIDTTRLTIQIVAIMLVTLLVYAVFAGNRKPPKNQDRLHDNLKV